MYGTTRILKTDQRQGFYEVLRRLPGPRSGNVTLKEWLILSGVYRGLKQLTPCDVWKAGWAEAKKVRKGLVDESRASEFGKALALYERHWQYQRTVWARETGFNADRERRRKERDPEGYRRANAERQRNRRARLKAAKNPPLNPPGDLAQNEGYFAVAAE